MTPDQVPATWFARDVGIRRLVSLHRGRPSGAAVAVFPARVPVRRQPLGRAGCGRRPAGGARRRRGRRPRPPGASPGSRRPASVMRSVRSPRAVDSDDELGGIELHRRQPATARRTAATGFGRVAGPHRSLAGRAAPTRPPRRRAATCAGACPARRPRSSRPIDAVRAILADVRARGDAALRELTERFDGRPARRAAGARRPRSQAALDAHRPRRCGPRSRWPAPTSPPSTRPSATPTPSTTTAASSSASCSGPVDRAGCYVPRRWPRSCPPC